MQCIHSLSFSDTGAGERKRRGVSAKVGISNVDLPHMTSIIYLSDAVADHLFPVVFAMLLPCTVKARE